MNHDLTLLKSSRLKEQRMKVFRSAREAAESLGWGASRWLNWESAVTSPPVDLYPEIAEALKTNPAYLAGWIDDPAPDLLNRPPSIGGSQLGSVSFNNFKYA